MDFWENWQPKYVPTYTALAFPSACTFPLDIKKWRLGQVSALEETVEAMKPQQGF